MPKFTPHRLQPRTSSARSVLFASYLFTHTINIRTTEARHTKCLDGIFTNTDCLGRPLQQVSQVQSVKTIVTTVQVPMVKGPDGQWIPLEYEELEKYQKA